MQKVSKQSLAMLALSILLAISIALTLTFAALSDTKTATGTITFQGNVALLVGATGSEAAENYTFTISDPADSNAINTQLQGISYKLAATSQDAYIRVTAEVNNGTSTDAVTLTAKTASGYTSAALVQTSDAAITAGTANTLGALYTAALDLTALDGSTGTIDDITITFTITAQAQNFA